MPIERVDYYSDDDYQHAIAIDADEEKLMQEEYLNNCMMELKKLVDSYDMQTVHHCLSYIKEDIPEQEKGTTVIEPDPDIPF